MHERFSKQIDYGVAMTISRLIIGVLSICFISTGHAEASTKSAKAASEILHLIRKEKFDLILPGAMRDNGVDMWIHVIRAGNPDPMAIHFGSVSGYIVFTDRGGDRIERAVLGDGNRPPLQMSKIFDRSKIPGTDEVDSRWLKHHGGGPADLYDIFGSPDEIREFVATRDPKTIAVNTSSWLAVSDGISYSEYVKLERALGPKYSKRIVSAEHVITDFRARRVQSEITAFSRALEMHRRILERALSNEVITPGVTTLGDVGWWVQEQFLRHGLLRDFDADVSIPRILYSAKSKPIDPPDVRWWIHHPEYVIERGDFGTFDIGTRYLNYFTTDYKRNFYVLREDERSIPESIQRAYDRAVNARDIIRKNIRVGQTAEQTLKLIVSALEEADYVYTPFMNIGTEDYKMIQTKMTSDKSGFSIDLHSMGNNGGTVVTVGPSVAPFRLDRAHLKIQENHFCSFEYMVHTNLPERPGFPVSINIEGNHIVTSRGVELLHPPNERILLVH
jgi:Xaa-Pro aminopeptidase